MKQLTHHARLNRITAIGLTIALTIVTLTSIVQAENFTVTKTADSFDGVCNTDCSLREAIFAANQSTDLMDIVVVPAGVFTLTITGTEEDDGLTGDLDIKGATLFLGQGPGLTIIDASGLGERVVHVLSNAVITFRDFTITGGNSPINLAGGGILNRGTLTLDNVHVTNNEGPAGGGVASWDATELIVKNGSRITGNKGFLDGVATGEGGGITVRGGGSLTVTDSTIADNQTQFSGGGIIVVASDATITRSTISGNWITDSSGKGGGLLASAGATVSLVNSTVTGNQAFSNGGGIFVFNAQVNLHSVSMSGNSQFLGGAIGSDGGSVSFLNTIIAGDCAGDATFTNEGNSIESPANTCQLNQVVPDLLLSELGNFGGMTQTLLPLPGSPAINFANSHCLDTDQRGESRGALCAAGAVERLVSDPMFLSGFESGDTSEWSSAVQQ